VVEGRLDWCAPDGAAVWGEAIDQHLPPPVIPQKRNARRSVDLCETFAKRDQGSIEVGRSCECVR